HSVSLPAPARVARSQRQDGGRGMSYFYHLLIYLDIYVVVALSLNIIVGYCGRLTLAHAGYFAVGGYAYALAVIKLGWSALPSMALAGAVAAAGSLAVSLPAWR